MGKVQSIQKSQKVPQLDSNDWQWQIYIRLLSAHLEESLTFPLSIKEISSVQKTIFPSTKVFTWALPLEFCGGSLPNGFLCESCQPRHARRC